MNDYLKVEELKPGYTYRIRARNGTVGVWYPEVGEFILSRYKFGSNYTFGEIHYDLSDHFGTARPYEELEKCPLYKPNVDGDTYHAIVDFNEVEMLKYLNEWEHKLRDPHPKERPPNV